MDYKSGNIFIRAPVLPLSKGQVVDGHKHNFDHTTYIKAGAARIELLDVASFDVTDAPAVFTVVASKIIHATDEINWMLIMKGRFHRITALEDGTMYHCIFSHKAPQVVSLTNPGMQAQEPYSKRDENGTLWVRVDETVLQDTADWIENYR